MVYGDLLEPIGSPPAGGGGSAEGGSRAISSDKWHRQRGS